MNNLQRVGGLSALVNAAAYIVGLALAMTFLAPYLEGPPVEYVSVLAAHETLFFIWHLLIYLVAGVFMVPMVLALHERLQYRAPGTTQIVTAFGLIWTVTVIASGMLIINNQTMIADLYHQDPAQATAVYLALSTIEEGLGGGIELPGGLWILLAAWTAWRYGGLPKGIAYLGLIVGLAGVLTVVPALHTMGYVFGIGAIVWFLWIGIIMLRDGSNVSWHSAHKVSTYSQR